MGRENPLAAGLSLEATGANVTTRREMDALLADKAIGCQVEWRADKRGTRDPWCGCPIPGPNHTSHEIYFWGVHPYYSAPTWETTGQLYRGAGGARLDL